MAASYNTIEIIQVKQILEGARLQGHNVNTILQRADISPALMDSTLSRVSQKQFTDLIRILRRVTDDEFWGLCSRPLKPGSFAFICRELVNCRTLKEAFRKGLTFYHLAVDDFAPRLRIDGKIAYVEMHPRAARTKNSRFVERTFLFFAHGLSCWLTARWVPLLSVDLLQIDKPVVAGGSRLFQIPMNYQDQHVRLCLETRWLELPILQNAESVEVFLHNAPGSLVMKYRDRTSVTERLRHLLRRHLESRLPTFDEISRMLAMTPQTLRRRLSEEGHNYQSIKEEFRRDAAINFLAKPDLSLADIAYMLGFSEPSTFYRAFKKWTGVAPGEYRQSRILPGKQ